MTQEELTTIFNLLDAGEVMEGWGMSRHLDFDTLFNSERRQWQRDRFSDTWIEMKELARDGWR
ncbi:hypothetical protein [Devosia sp. CN2-171]|uniref:hypothetical protein n=1 Tax=Devosia sp. CN2-171 TaxID=3400909 RepID=UPI003BF7E8D8